MSIMKKSVLALALVATTANLLPHGGDFGAGFATGAVAGGLTGAAVNSDRSYYDDYPAIPDRTPIVYNDYDYDYDDGIYVGNGYGSYGRSYRRGDRGYKRSSPRTTSLNRTTARSRK